MSELAPNALHAERHAELRALIASSRQRLAGAGNAELTRLYWSVGDQLAQEFGRGFEAKNLRRRMQLAHAFRLPEIVATLSRQLSWSHFVNLLPLKTEPARQLCASRAAANTWGVRELRAHRACPNGEELFVRNCENPKPHTTGEINERVF